MQFRTGSLLILAALFWLWTDAGLNAQESMSSDELARHVADMKTQSEDGLLPVTQRGAAILGAAGALDRAAHSAPEMAQKQSHWAQAIELLDGFNSQNAGHPRLAEFQLQCAVYRWAQGQSWRDSLDRRPRDPKLRDLAVSALDDSIVRLRSVDGAGLEQPIAENLRFRLARALSDRAEIDPPGSARRRELDAEALRILQEPLTEPGLKGFAGLLRAELLRRDRRLDAAVAEVASAAKAQPSPPETEIYDVLVAILVDQGRFVEAEKAVRNSGQAGRIKDVQLFRIALARTLSAPSPDERLSLEREVFRQADVLRQTKTDEADLALLTLGNSDLKPDPRQDPLAWDLLAEAHELLGDVEKAAALEQQAARRAVEIGQKEAAAGYLLKGGGFLFRARKYAEADAILSQVAADPNAGKFRPKAGMLRALARGRALADGSPGVTSASYAASLEDQLREFPKDPSTDEARWLLGSLLAASSDIKGAQRLWSEIPQGSTRWLEARLATLALERRSLEDRLLSGDRQAILVEAKKLQDDLSRSHLEARGEHERVELALAEAWLNLLPIVGRPRQALDGLDRLSARTMTGIQRYRLRLDRIVAVVHLGPPFLEAEREAQTHASWADKTAHDVLLEALRLLDLCASTSDADVRQRRFGLVARLLIQPVVDAPDDAGWTPEQRSELKIRLARANLFLGDERGAREALRGWTGPPPNVGDRLLRDIADTYSRLEAYKLAIDVQRMRSKSLAAGSPAWFDARYGLALAYFHSGQHQDAAQLIDATAILHPDLGGGSIQQKLIRLRQRLGQRR